ncbi:MAG: DUF1998 domain-containing protein, partial [Actinomycetes bacterium]
GNVDATASGANGQNLLTLTYGDAATIRIANLGMRRRKPGTPDGFYVNTSNGRWLSEAAAARNTGTPMADLDDEGKVTTKARVIPFVEDTRNILVARLAEAADDIVSTTLRYALERGIEAEFQLEDSELSSQALPEEHGRGRSLFMEANEGGAGVLRRLIDEPAAIAAVARRALEITHFTPDGEDTLAEATGDARCEKACYDCLLSYSNQFDHPMIDRHHIRDLLLALAGGKTERTDDAPESDHLADLRARCDSTLETDFLDYLASHDHRLPTSAQEAITDAMVRPDFIYDTGVGPAAVFLDGPTHDDDHQHLRDAQARARLVDLGWFVIAIRYDDDWPTRVAQYQQVFGQGR